MVSFGGDINRAGQFACSLLDFVLKGGCADVVWLVAAEYKTVGLGWSEATASESMILSCH